MDFFCIFFKDFLGAIFKDYKVVYMLFSYEIFLRISSVLFGRITRLPKHGILKDFIEGSQGCPKVDFLRTFLKDLP